MTNDEMLLIQNMLKSIRKTHLVIHNLAAVATSAMPGTASEKLRKSLISQLESAQQSANAAQKILTKCLAQL